MNKDKKTVTDILKDNIGDLVSEDTLNQIEAVFNEQVDTRVSLHVEKALDEQDQEYSKQLDAFAQAIDADRTKKLQQVVEALDADRAKKLQMVAVKYKKAVVEEAQELRSTLIEQVSHYLDLYLEEMIPTDTINEAVRNKKAVKVLGDLRKTLAVDKALMSESMREAIVDGKKQIVESTQRAGALEQENAQLRDELNKYKAERILNEKSADLPQDQREYIEKMLGGKSPQFVEENFDYTLRMFDKTEEERLAGLKQQANKTRKGAKVDRVVQESVETQQPTDNQYNPYLDELGKY